MSLFLALLWFAEAVGATVAMVLLMLIYDPEHAAANIAVYFCAAIAAERWLHILYFKPWIASIRTRPVPPGSDYDGTR